MMSAQVADLFKNREVVAVDQDPSGHSGTRSARHGLSEAWSRPITNGYPVALFNRDKTPRRLSVKWEEIGLSNTGSYVVRDLWEHHGVEVLKHGDSATVRAHGVVMIKVKLTRE